MHSEVDTARSNMVQQQVRTWDVLDPVVLDVIANTPRERFIPAAMRGLAFADTVIPLARGRETMPPKLEGRILQALEIRPLDRALELGTGSGFLAACMGRLAHQVTTVEPDATLAENARRALASTGIENVTVENTDPLAFEPAGEYDVIAISGSLPEYDPRFERWLTLGGRLLVIVGRPPIMEALLVRRAGLEEWARESLLETCIPPLAGTETRRGFVF